MSNPIEEFFHHRKTATAQRAQDDLDRWQFWNNNGCKPEHMQPLLKSFKPVITLAVNTYRAPTVQKAAFEAAATIQAIQAFESYDPNRGATAMATYHLPHHKPKQYSGLRRKQLATH